MLNPKEKVLFRKNLVRFVNGLSDREIKSFNINIETNIKFFVKDIVSGKECYSCYTHRSGTSNLLKHNCPKTSESQVTVVTQLITKYCTKITKVYTVPEKVKTEIQLKSLSFMLNQLLAFKTVHENLLENYCKNVLKSV